MSKFIQLHTKDGHDLISFNSERIDSVTAILKHTRDGGFISYTSIVCNGLKTDVIEDYKYVLSKIER